MITVTGYVYCADIYCPECVIGKVRARVGYGPFDYSADAETVLDQIAAANGINREDERTFDSGDFPKVILSLDDDGERCGECGENLGS